MKTNYHLRLPAMGAAALLSVAMLRVSASAATVAKFIEYVQTDGNSANGHRNHIGVVRERYRAGRWEHWDAKRGEWVAGETTKRKGVV